MLSCIPQAKNNVVGHLSKEARDLELSCTLNLMSCYLKTKQFSDVTALGSEVWPLYPSLLSVKQYIFPIMVGFSIFALVLSIVIETKPAANSSRSSIHHLE